MGLTADVTSPQGMLTLPMQLIPFRVCSGFRDCPSLISVFLIEDEIDHCSLSSLLYNITYYEMSFTRSFLDD